MTDLEKILALRGELWKQEEWIDRFRGPHKVWVEKRKLTVEEWEQLSAILMKNEFIIIPSTSHFGFQHAITVYRWPVMPGIDNPEPILQVVAGQLPWAESMPGDSHGRQPSNAWETFCAFTHTARQAEYRQFLEWDIPLEKYHYDY